MATIISCWEVLIVAMAVAAHVAVRVLHHMHPVTRHGTQVSTQAASTSPLHVVGLVLTYILAVAGAIALWEMRHFAFILLAARFAIEVLLFVEEMLRPVTAAGLQHSGVRMAFISIDLAALGVNAAIAWYAWHVTRQQPMRQVATEQNTPDTSAEAAMTTSQFYLSRDHKETIHKD